MKKFNKLGILGVLALASGSVMAAAPDAAVLVDTATTVSTSVMALCVTVGGFFLVYKIVKWIRK